MKVIVTAGRNYSDYHTVKSVLDCIHASLGITQIIQGGCTGADRLARVWAEDCRVEPEHIIQIGLV